MCVPIKGVILPLPFLITIKRKATKQNFANINAVPTFLNIVGLTVLGIIIARIVSFQKKGIRIMLLLIIKWVAVHYIVWKLIRKNEMMDWMMVIMHV